MLPVTKGDFKNLIDCYGQFPDDIRPFLWKKILSLPMNSMAYKNLCDKGLHLTFENVQEYPFLSVGLHLPVMRLASNLAHWCSLFSHLKYLPLAVLRFVKLFKSSPLTSFEVVATVIVNFCQHWFSDFPLSPNRITSVIKTIIEKFDFELWKHFNNFGINVSSLVRSIMETLFAEVLTDSDWLIFWDNVLVNDTNYLTVAIPVLLIMNRNIFLACESKDQFEVVVHNPMVINMILFIERIKQVSNSIKSDTLFTEFKPLLKGDNYESFVHYPKELRDKKPNQIIMRLNFVRMREMEIVSLTEEIRNTAVLTSYYEADKTQTPSCTSYQVEPFCSSSNVSQAPVHSILKEIYSVDLEKSYRRISDLIKEIHVLRKTNLGEI